MLPLLKKAQQSDAINMLATRKMAKNREGDGVVKPFSYSLIPPYAWLLVQNLKKIAAIKKKLLCGKDNFKLKFDGSKT